MKVSTLIFGAVSLLIQKYADEYQKEDLRWTLSALAPDLSLPRISTYDFIIVGGGSGGCLLASKLSERFTVLVLEEGGTPVPNTFNNYQAMLDGTYYHPAINRLYPIHLKNIFQVNGGLINISTGRMLGGSGSHNDNGFYRGSPYDYDNYANVTGDPSWGYWNVLPFFKRIENFIGYLVHENDRACEPAYLEPLLYCYRRILGYYGQGGPITVSTLTPALLPLWFQAAKELGYNIGDTNGYQREAFTPYVKAISNGERESSYRKMLHPLENVRSSLKILRYSEVDQILIKDKVAYGVTYKRHGIPQIAHASKEIIVSSGALVSPIILMKSGIGPRAVLNAAGIEVVVDLPGVGSNLNAQIAVGARFSVSNPDPHIFPTLRESDVDRELIKFHEYPRSGYFATIGSDSLQPVQANIVSERAKVGGEPLWPDLLIGLTPIQPLGTFPPNSTMLSGFTALTRAKSVGALGLNVSAYLSGERRAKELAVVDLNALSEPSDIEALLFGLKLIVKVVEETGTFRRMGPRLNIGRATPCESLPYKSDDFWKCYIGQFTMPWDHFGGTCKMGKREDPLAVVDSKLRVRGVGHLRVMDPSVLPRLPNSHLNSPTLLTAEKTSYEILAEYGAITG